LGGCGRFSRIGPACRQAGFPPGENGRFQSSKEGVQIFRTIPIGFHLYIGAFLNKGKPVHSYVLIPFGPALFLGSGLYPKLLIDQNPKF
jgi:hypothetical protein